MWNWHGFQFQTPYTYEFVANNPGTYWYHSHQNGVEQLDKGLYGTKIIESQGDKNVDRDYTLVLDEWESGNHNEADASEMEDMVAIATVKFSNF